MWEAEGGAVLPTSRDEANPLRDREEREDGGNSI
jgi:hypothetical protein